MMYLKEARRWGSNRSIGSAAAPPGGGVEEARRWILQAVVELQASLELARSMDRAVAVRRSRRPRHLIFLASLASWSRQRARGASQRRGRPDPVEERRRGKGRSASTSPFLRRRPLSRRGSWRRRCGGEEPAPPASLAPSSIAYYTWVLLYAILLMILFSPFDMFYISSQFYFLRTVAYNIAFTNGTGLTVTGSIDIHSVYATALRRAHPGAAGNY
ncbi:unnamed protein product [Urochloa humidicola]